MGLTVAKCPACGADLNLETDRDYFYCPHCGSKVIQVDDRIVIEHVNRTVDEAEVKKVEFEREKYVVDEQRRKEEFQKSDKRSKKTMIIGAVIAVIGLILKQFPGDISMTGMAVVIVGLGALMVGFMNFSMSDMVNKSNQFKK